MSDLLNFSEDTQSTILNTENFTPIIEVDKNDTLTSFKEIHQENLKGILSFLHDSDIEDNEVVDSQISVNNAISDQTHFTIETQESSVNVPIKRNTKTYEKDKINLLGESQRLIRESQTNSFNHKPKAFKTISEMKDAIKLSQTRKLLKVNNKENIVRPTEDKQPEENITESSQDTVKEDNVEESKDPLPLRDRLNLGSQLKAAINSQPKTNDNNKLSQNIVNLLRKKNNNNTGFIELKSESEWKQVEKNKEEILKNLKNAMRRDAGIEKDHYVDLNTTVKVVDPVTGSVGFKNKVITVKKDSCSKLVKTGIDENVAKQIKMRLTDEELLKWNSMSTQKKMAFHKQMMLNDVNAKRREKREKRQMDMPEVVQKAKKSPKKDNDGLSEDDEEWTEDKEADNSSDSEDQCSASNDESDEDTDSNDEENVQKRSSKPLRIGYIEDDDDEEDNTVEIAPFVDVGSTIDESMDFNFDESYIQDIGRVKSPTSGVRERKKWEMSPKFLDDDVLKKIPLPKNASRVISDLKTKFGFGKKLIGRDSSVVLLPTMKTSTKCIERVFKESILKDGQLSPSVIGPYEDMLKEEEPTMKVDWKHKFNYMTSILADTHYLACYSFVNRSEMSCLQETQPVMPVDLDDTVEMDPGPETQVDELPATVLMHEDGASNSTIVMSSENSRDGVQSFGSYNQNNIHAQLFAFQDETQPMDVNTLARKTFADLSSLMKDTEEDKDIVEETKEDNDKIDQDGESSVEEDEDDVDLDESGEEIDGTGSNDEESSKSESDVDDEDEEEVLRKKVTKTKFMPKDFIDDEAASSESDEEEVLRKTVKKTRFIPKEYFEDEAALSGSDAEDYGSDEDERGMDEYEDEEGDQEKLPSVGKLRRQIGLIHNKLEIDKDAHDIQYLKEMYMEDGDLDIGDGGPRKKRFDWAGLDGGEDFAKIARESDNEEESDYDDQVMESVMIEDEVDENEKKQRTEAEEGSLMSKYDKFLVNSRSGATRQEEVQVRSAWQSSASGPTTGVPGETVDVHQGRRPAIKRFGSMLNKAIGTIDTSSAPARTTINDLDLKTKMSVMYSSTSRQTEALKRAPSFVTPAVPKKQKTNE